MARVALPFQEGDEEKLGEFLRGTGEGDALVHLVVTGDALALHSAESVTAESEAALLDALQEHASGVASASLFLLKVGSPGWRLVTYADDSLHSAKAKMLVALTQETLQKQLSFVKFLPSHHATSLDELNSAALHDSSDSAAQEAPLSQAERAAVTVAAAESEARQAGAQGGAEVPFKASEALLAALSGFAEGALLINLDASERFHLLSQHSSVQAAKAALPADDAAYLLFHTQGAGGGVKLLLWCPDGTGAKTRMVASTAKGALRSHAEAVGVEVAGSADAHDMEDVEEVLGAGGPAAVAASAAAASADDSAAVQQLQFAKPAAPGAGRRKPRKTRGKPQMAFMDV